MSLEISVRKLLQDTLAFKSSVNRENVGENTEPLDLAVHVLEYFAEHLTIALDRIPTSKISTELPKVRSLIETALLGPVQCEYVDKSTNRERRREMNKDIHRFIENMEDGTVLLSDKQLESTVYEACARARHTLLDGGDIVSTVHNMSEEISEILQRIPFAFLRIKLWKRTVLPMLKEFGEYAQDFMESDIIPVSKTVNTEKLLQQLLNMVDNEGCLTILSSDESSNQSTQENTSSKRSSSVASTSPDDEEPDSVSVLQDLQSDRAQKIPLTGAPSGYPSARYIQAVQRQGAHGAPQHAQRAHYAARNDSSKQESDRHVKTHAPPVSRRRQYWSRGRPNFYSGHHHNHSRSYVPQETFDGSRNRRMPSYDHDEYTSAPYYAPDQSALPYGIAEEGPQSPYASEGYQDEWFPPRQVYRSGFPFGYF